ncbi:gfo/Idh/MocA family oxidoreductase [Candidatus Woesearchaeota archaeon]|nr:MAG: gfo/Idh/MocA family oxidoreductase [Candidatus Woesearchaeota archaeon]
MEKIRVGVIGTGYLGKFHAEKYSKMDNVEIVGVVDVNKARADNIAKEYETQAYSDHRDILGKVDAVSIVVPTHAHYAVSKDFLEHDTDILIEKPMALTLDQADELIQLAELNGLLIQVGHLERFNPAVVALNDFVRDPMFIESHRLATYKDRSTDVSVVLDLMIHDIDIILNFVNSKIKLIHSAGVPVVTGEVDIANVRLEFENGCIANITASRISTKNKRKIRLFQRDAYLSVDFANYEITVIKKDSKKTDALIPNMDIKQFCFTKADALNDEIISFVNAVTKREAPEVTGRMGRDALKIALNVTNQIKNRNSTYLTKS